MPRNCAARAADGRRYGSSDMARLGIMPRRALAIFALAIIHMASAGPALAARDEWLAVRDVSLKVVPGSALDFSAMFPALPAGSSGRVVANAEGALAFEKEPAARARFHCASLAWSPASGSYPDHTTADVYAEQLRLHGYNLARLHYVDANLMTGRDRDFDLDPVQLDNFRYLLAALKRNGIHWMIDAATSENGGYGGVMPDRWTIRHDHKLQVHISEEARRHWLRLASAMLGTTNPYTGLRPLDDPALAIVTLFNEGGLEFASYLEENRTHRAYPDALKAPFNAWLATLYKDTTALAKAWGGALKAGESLEWSTVDLPARHGERGPRMRDLQRFFTAREAETFLWMRTALASLGYRGLVTAYNNTRTTAASLTRKELPLVSFDSYHDEVLSLEPGTSIAQTSSLDDDAGYLRAMMAARWHGRPYVVAEYDHLFWNAFRHEAGLVVPAYAALQGFDAVCRHGWGPIDLAYGSSLPHKSHMLPYGLGLDPIARASETLAALLYRRGDVAEARQALLVPFHGARDLIDDGQGELPDSTTRLGLLTRMALSETTPTTGRSTLPPGPPGPSASQLPRWLDKLSDKLTGASARTFEATLDRLAADGVLTAEVARGARNRIYRSDTGEIVLDAPARTIRVVTARTEAVSLPERSAPLPLGRVTVRSLSTPALLAVSSLDGATLAASRRMLVILSTDTMNSGMTFKDETRRTITGYGRLPVLLKRGRAALSLDIPPPSSGAPENLKLSALHLDGTIAGALAVNRRSLTVEADIDTAAGGHGPTTFFLLER